MALSDNALISLEDIKEYYFSEDDINKSQDDNLLEQLINSYTMLFENFCGVDSFHTTTYTEYIDGKKSYYLYVRNAPINSITTLYDDLDWEWLDSDLIDSDDYRISGDKRYLICKYNFTEGDQNIKITYSGGYDTIPDDLKMTCLMEVSRAFEHRHNVDVISEALDAGGSKTVIQLPLMPLTKKILFYYKREVY